MSIYVEFIHAQTRYPIIIFRYLPSHTCVSCYVYSEPGNNRVDTYASPHKLSSYEAFYVSQMTDNTYSCFSCNEAAGLQ